MNIRNLLGTARQKILKAFFGKNLYANTEFVNDLKGSILEQRARMDNFSRLSWYRIQKYAPSDKYPEILCDWYHEMTGEKLNLAAPRSFNEKIQWLKLYDCTELKTRLTDKYLARSWVAEKIGEEHLIPLCAGGGGACGKSLTTLILTHCPTGLS
jgi:hypothetical protein